MLQIKFNLYYIYKHNNGCRQRVATVDDLFDLLTISRMQLSNFVSGKIIIFQQNDPFLLHNRQAQIFCFEHLVDDGHKCVKIFFIIHKRYMILLGI